MMICCEKEVQAPDLATKIKLSALEEVRRKNIIKNLYFLTGCDNPYGVDGVVIKDDKTALTAYYCGELVFVWRQGDLKRYICQDDNWTNIVTDEAERIRTERNLIRLQETDQQLKNKVAKKNYVTC
jgi:hypothetical protein